MCPFKAIEKAKEVITGRFRLSLNKVELVSRGAAWADHIAVSLYLLEEVNGLILHFPTKFITKNEKPHFFDTGEKNWKTNPGRTANLYHEAFSNEIKDNSLQQIYSAIAIGAKYREHKGFHERNSFVAKSDYLIAFTWSYKEEPKKGTGTYDIWKKCSKGTRKIHVLLKSLVDSPAAMEPMEPSTKK
uniref:Uncharacterized protein n=1 Tax=Amphimedon queenslandica TaxID=400682 RepID=A0A1X7UQN9_AMPQE